MNFSCFAGHSAYMILLQTKSNNENIGDWHWMII